MILTKHQSQLLGLHERDQAVLNALDHQSLSFTSLAQKVKLPRTSLYTTVKKLLQRNMVSKVKKGKRNYYTLVSRETLHRSFEKLADTFSEIGNSKNKKFILRGKMSSEYLVYRGIDNLVGLYKRFGELDKYSRVYAIQPNISAYSVMKLFPYKELVRINQKIKDNKIIVEGILQENFIDYYKDKLKKERKPVKDIFEAYGGRMADTHYVSKEYLNFDSELMMTKDFAVIANWREHVAVEIRDRETISLLVQLFEFIKSQSSKVDQNPIVQKLIRSDN